jgi:hypothetical protein
MSVALELKTVVAELATNHQRCQRASVQCPCVRALSSQRSIRRQYADDTRRQSPRSLLAAKARTLDYVDCPSPSSRSMHLNILIGLSCSQAMNTADPRSDIRWFRQISSFERTDSMV